MASRITRSVPVTISDVLDGHVRLDLECLDLWVPRISSTPLTSRVARSAARPR